MYGELGSIREVVDLSPQDALDRAQSFLGELGYATVGRTDTSLSVQRHTTSQAAEQSSLNLTVVALPQPEGGVRIAVRGNDREGMQEHQAAWTEWSENLPKKPEARTAQPTDQTLGAAATDVPLSPPPRVESQPVPPPPRQESTVWRGTKLAFGGCVILPILLMIGLVGCFAIVGGGGEEEPAPQDQSAVSIGEPVPVGDVTWTVTDAKKASRLTARFADPAQGNFVIVNFRFTNNDNEAVTLHNNSLALFDSEGNKSEVDSDKFQYISDNRRILLESINPGVTKEGQVIFTVSPNSSGFKLQAGDTRGGSNKNGYIDMGF